MLIRLKWCLAHHPIITINIMHLYPYSKHASTETSLHFWCSRAFAGRRVPLWSDFLSEPGLPLVIFWNNCIRKKYANYKVRPAHRFWIFWDQAFKDLELCLKVGRKRVDWKSPLVLISCFFWRKKYKNCCHSCFVCCCPGDPKSWRISPNTRSADFSNTSFSRVEWAIYFPCIFLYVCFFVYVFCHFQPPPLIPLASLSLDHSASSKPARCALQWSPIRRIDWPFSESISQPAF